MELGNQDYKYYTESDGDKKLQQLELLLVDLLEHGMA